MSASDYCAKMQEQFKSWNELTELYIAAWGANHQPKLYIESLD